MGLYDQRFTNIAANTAAFPLNGGQYAVTVHATFGGGSVTLQKLAADGATFVTCLTAFAADGFATCNLPTGTYRFAIVTATGVYIDLNTVVGA